VTGNPETEPFGVERRREIGLAGELPVQLDDIDPHREERIDRGASFLGGLCGEVDDRDIAALEVWPRGHDPRADE